MTTELILLRKLQCDSQSAHIPPKCFQTLRLALHSADGHATKSSFGRQRSVRLCDGQVNHLTRVCILLAEGKSEGKILWTEKIYGPDCIEY